jgi:hypothetical protein
MVRVINQRKPGGPSGATFKIAGRKITSLPPFSFQAASLPNQQDLCGTSSLGFRPRFRLVNIYSGKHRLGRVVKNMHRTFISFCFAAFVVGASGLGSFKPDPSSPPLHRAGLHLKKGDQSQLKSSDASPISSLHTKRLELRGGGLPILLMGAAALTATATNEGVRSRFLKALSNVRIGPYQLKQKPRLKKVVDVAQPKQAAIGTTPDVRNGTWAREVLDEVEVLNQLLAFCTFEVKDHASC